MDNQTNQLTRREAGPVVKPEPAELRAQIAETRAEMGNTIEALHGRLNPTVLKEQAIEQFHEAAATIKTELRAHFADAKEHLKAELVEAKTSLKAEVTHELAAAKAAVREATIGKVETMLHNAKETVRDTGRSVVDIVKANPIPAALIGIGLGWMFMSARRARTHAEPLQLAAGDDTAERGRINEFAHAAGRKIADGAQGVASAVGGAVGGAAHRVGDAASYVAHGVADNARGAQQRVASMYEVNPIAIGAVALAVGAAVGLAIPITNAESRLLGAARNTVIDKAQELAHAAMDKAGDVAKGIKDNTSEMLTDGAKKTDGTKRTDGATKPDGAATQSDGYQSLYRSTT